MNALRIPFLLLAFAILGLLGWRLSESHPQVADSRVVAFPKPAQAPRSTSDSADAKKNAALPSPAQAPPARVVTLEDRLAEVPEFASFYGKLKADFPRDYAAFAGQVASEDGVSTGNAAIWDAMRDLQQSQGVLAAQAGSAALDRYFEARLAMLDGLAPLNARRCVDFLYGMTDSSIAGFTATHHGLVATLAERQIEAIEDGRSRHIERSAPTDADLDALSAALASRQVSAQEIGVLIDGTTPDPPIPDKRLCELGRLYLEVLHELPPGTRQRIYGLAAELLARS